MKRNSWSLTTTSIAPRALRCPTAFFRLLFFFSLLFIPSLNTLSRRLRRRCSAPITSASFKSNSSLSLSILERKVCLWRM
ncbi:hypothetical protein Bca4012_063369 [Brassica carinata]